MGHAQTAGCLMIAFAAAVALDGASAARGRGSAWILGVSGGWAVVTEFPAAVPAILIGLLALDRVRAARPVARLVPGRSCAIALGVTIAGDSAARLRQAGVRLAVPPRLCERGRLRGDARRLLRHHLPEAVDRRRTALGSFRGLLPLAPLTALAPIGLALLARAPDARGPRPSPPRSRRSISC